MTATPRPAALTELRASLITADLPRHLDPEAEELARLEKKD